MAESWRLRANFLPLSRQGAYRDSLRSEVGRGRRTAEGEVAEEMAIRFRGRFPDSWSAPESHPDLHCDRRRGWSHQGLSENRSTMPRVAGIGHRERRLERAKHSAWQSHASPSPCGGSGAKALTNPPTSRGDGGPASLAGHPMQCATHT